MSDAQAPRRVLILGVGSPFGADRLGWRAVEQLQQTGLADRFPALTLRFEQSDRPGSRLLMLLRDADVAVVIDAMRSGAAAGSVARFAEGELTPDAGLFSTHGFGVAEALALGRQLGMLSAKVIVYGIEADAALLDDTLSVQGSAALLAMLQQDLATLLQP